MTTSDASYIIFMHTGINDWQRKIVLNIYLKKVSLRLLIPMLLAFAITIGFLTIPMGFLIATNFQIQIPVYIYIVLILSTVVTIVLFFINWRYFLKQTAVERELIEYYGEYPKELERIIIENSEQLTSGKLLPPVFYQKEKELLDKTLSKPE